MLKTLGIMTTSLRSLADFIAVAAAAPPRGGTALPVTMLLLALAMPLIGCSGSSTQAQQNQTPPNDSAEGFNFGGNDMLIEPIEGRIDTVEFHIGSPLFLRMRLHEGSACKPHNGYPFFFDATGAQLGWGFEEVTDSLLFPDAQSRCERIIMLSSERSNRLPEGHFTLTTELFIDEKTKLRSDTILLYPHRSTGADERSYTRFLIEQILTNGSLLRSDPQTVEALFAEGVPQSAESEVYRAVILYQVGDINAALQSLRRSTDLETKRQRYISAAARATRDELLRRMEITLEEAAETP